MNTEKQKKYMDGVLRLNEFINLTAITDPDECYIKHTLDSLVCLDYPEFKGAKTVIDVGTGAGFPGMPLAIECPDKKFVLMDSLLKRLKVIDELAAETGVSNIETVHGRAEELGKNKAHREKYDVCISRAVSNLATLSEYCLPFIKVGGYLLAYKGPDAENEIRDAKKAISVLGGKVTEVREAKLEEYGISHNVVIIEKVKSTPAKYPRKAGTPLKEPIR